MPKILSKTSTKTSIKTSNVKPYKFNQAQLQWLEDLESGKFKKCIGSLCEVKNGREAYCCLGVACERLVPKKLIIKNEDYKTYSMEDVYLPDYVQKKLKLVDTFGPISDKTLVNLKDPSLAGLNDQLRWSFKKIAKFIRNNPRAVFTG